MDNPTNIYSLIKQQETAYALAIQMNESWSWSMKEHIKLSTLYKNSQFVTGNSQSERDGKPFKNIVRPILNLRYRAEDIDVKDILLYVDDPDSYHLSFLVKKYHDDVFVIENDLDTYFDELKESKIDFGGGLSKKTNKIKPEVVPLQSIAFCDQTDILSGPIAIKHFFSPDQLMEMKDVGWGDKKNGATITLEDLIILSRGEKRMDSQINIQTKTPGKYIEVYEVHGNMPEHFLEEDANPFDEKYVTQLQIVAFYKNSEGIDEGVTLFRGKETESPFKLVQSDKIYGRALGYGGVEELFDAQVWTNYSEIQIKDMLDAASKIILRTTDSSLAQKHPTGLKGMDNLEIVEHAPNTELGQMDTQPRNIQLFNQSVNEWWTHAQTMGGATDALLGQTPPSGTPFRLEALTSQQGQGLHSYRRGKFAKHIEEIYKDWIIPEIAKKITKGTRFLSELSLEEMQYVADCVVRNAAKEYEDELVLSGQQIDPAITDMYKQKVRDEFMAKGSKWFLEILKGEFSKMPIRVKVNVAGKQKDLQAMTDKIGNVMRFLFSTYNPQTGTFAALEDPKMAKLLNQIFEYSGLDPIDIGSSYGKPQQMMQPQMIQQSQQMQPQMQQQPVLA